ncbi:hypothetical protein H0H93_007850 [Arthromyces matolae]|nr:hypothetical protein H0H93_007850 [Arthromyces matolae]
MKPSLLLLCLGLTATAQASSWFGSSDPPAPYASWSASELKSWLQAHDISIPSKSPSQDQLKALVQQNWNSVTTWSYDHYNSVQKYFADVHDSSFDSWDQSRLREFLLSQGIIAPKGNKEQLHQWLVSHNVLSPAPASPYSREYLLEQMQKYYYDVNDSVYCAWSDSQLKAWLVDHGIVKSNAQVNREKMRKLVENNYLSAKSTLSSSWSDSQVRDYLVEHGYIDDRTASKKKRDDLLKLFQDKYHSAVTPSYLAWPDARLRAYLRQHHVPEEKLPLSRPSLLQETRIRWVETQTSANALWARVRDIVSGVEGGIEGRLYHLWDVIRNYGQSGTCVGQECDCVGKNCQCDSGECYCAGKDCNCFGAKCQSSVKRAAKEKYEQGKQCVGDACEHAGRQYTEAEAEYEDVKDRAYQKAQDSKESVGDKIRAAGEKLKGESMSYTIADSAYFKIFFHAAKHPHKPVNGVLLGKKVDGVVLIEDAIPLLHHWTSLSPMMEIGLDLVCRPDFSLTEFFSKLNPTIYVLKANQYSKSVDLTLVGYYQAGQRLDEASLVPVGEKIVAKLKEGFSDSVAFVIDGDKLGTDEAALIPYTSSSGSTSWRPVANDPAPFTAGSSFKFASKDVPRRATALVRDERRHQKFGDFDDHLEDVSIDWLRNRAENIVMPDAFFASSKPRKRKRVDSGGKASSSNSATKFSRKGSSVKPAAGKYGSSKVNGPQTKKRRPADEELSDQTDEDEGGVDDMDLRADEDDIGVSGEEDEDETPAEKRLRLAKLYLESVKEGLAEGEFDAAEIDKDLISARLKQDVLEHSGKIHLFIADSFDFSQLPPKVLRTRGHRFSITSAVASQCGKYLFTAAKDGSIIQWDLLTGKRLTTFHKIRPPKSNEKGKGKAQVDLNLKGHTDEILALALSDDGKYLASAGKDRKLVVWDVEKAAWVKAFGGQLGHKDTISALSFRKGTHQLYTGSFDRTLKVYDLSPTVMGYVETLFGHQDHVLSLDSLRGETCVSVGARDKTIRFWKIVDETQLVFRGGGRSRIREVLDGGLRGDDEGDDIDEDMDGSRTKQTTKNFIEGSLECVAMIDETTFISGGDSGYVNVLFTKCPADLEIRSLCLWSTLKKKPIFIEPLAHGLNEVLSETEGLIRTPRWITSVASLPYSDLFASGSWEGVIRIWKLDSRLKSFSLMGTLPAPGVVNSIQLLSPPAEFFKRATWVSPSATENDVQEEPVTSKAKSGPQQILLVAGMGQEPRLGRWLHLKEGVTNGTIVVALSPRTLS